MTKDEALKLALEVFERVKLEFSIHQMDEAITAIKQALEAPVQEPPDDGFTQALIERDEYHAIADELAEMIAKITGEDIGEHTSANFPWRNALDAAENWFCHPPATPVQEPVACVQDLDEVKRKHLVYEKGMDWKDPLYTTPPAQRQWVEVECPLCGEMAVANTHPNLNKQQWVGLTDEEHMHLAEEWGCLSSDWVLYAAAVERKIKEKNV